MVIDLLLQLGQTIIGFFWQMVPPWDVAVPPEVGGFISEMSKWNKAVAFSELMLITALMGSLTLATWGLKVVVKILDWIMDIIP